MLNTAALNLSLPASVRAFLACFAKEGLGAWAVGGCVRDSLLGHPPHDWDICTEAMPEKVKAIFAKRGCPVIPTGERHGTVTVLWEARPIEVTTLRRDGAYTDSRHPDEVCFVNSLREDLARRDFTINAIAATAEGEVIDPFGGREDLARGLVRAVGEPERRFAEDALRILRCLRFAASLGFAIEPATARAARAAAKSLRSVSAERIFAELDRLVQGPGAAEVLGAFPEVCVAAIPQLEPTVGFSHEKPEFFAEDVWGHTVSALREAGSDRLVRWALLLHDIGKPACFVRDETGVGQTWGHEAVSACLANEALLALRADKATRRAVVELVAAHGEIPAPTRLTALQWLRRFGPQQAERLLEVKRCDLAARLPSAKTLRFRQELEGFGRCLHEAEKNGVWRLGQLAVSGKDLLLAGLPEGERLGRSLEDLLEAVMKGETPNEKQALIARALRQG